MEPRELILHISEDVLNRLSTEDIILPKTSSFILKPGDLKDALAQYQTVLQTIKFLTLQHSCNAIECRLYPSSHNLYLPRNEKIA